jgi:molecular chaperone GrpE
VIGTPLLQRLRRARGRSAPPQPADASADKAADEGLEALEKQLSRIGREQFKARALVEAQMDQVNAALDMLRTADERREAELENLRIRSRADQTAARLEVVQALLPALDGLDEAIRSGQRLLEQHAASPRSSTLLGRFRPPPTPPEEVELREAMAAWLAGLTFVRQRLLDVLAAEGVQPIETRNRPFDPHFHVAQEVLPASETVPVGTIIAELRRGYVVGDRVLRYAEVAVAGETGI